MLFDCTFPSMILWCDMRRSLPTFSAAEALGMEGSVGGERGRLLPACLNVTWRSWKHFQIVRGEERYFGGNFSLLHGALMGFLVGIPTIQYWDRAIRDNFIAEHSHANLGLLYGGSSRLCISSYLFHVWVNQMSWPTLGD